ncbi:MAG TPA: APC family permease [Candidatus Baltobacteraceae bacterium]|nr:APC family permease [Candidatus Baltobacteraceae bacterium]
MSTSSSRPTNAPSRVMGFRDLFLFYVVTGISLRWIATAAGHGPSSLVIWFLAWLLLYIPLALSVIHLSSRYPAEGGFYVWTKIAFGEQAGFLSAWMYWVSNLPYFPAVLYFAASNVLFLHPALQHYSQKPVYFVAFSVFILLDLTLLNILGLNLAKWAHNLGAIAMWIPALIIVVLGFTAWRHFGSATSFAPRNFLPTAHVQDMLFWSIVIFSFIGCESASLMAEEIKDARRNIPRALLLAGVTVALCYMLGTFCVLLAIPSSESSNLDGLAQAVAHSAARLQLSGVTAFAAFFIVISNIGAAGAYLAAAARLPFVAGLDGYLPAAFGKLHPRYKTPWISVLAQGLFGILFVFLGQAGSSVAGAYNILVAIAVVITMVPFMFLFASMIRLQNRRLFPDQLPTHSAIPTNTPSNPALDSASESFTSSTSFTSFTSRILGLIGFLSAAFATLLSLIPPTEEPHKLLYLAKLLGSTAALIALGLLLFHLGQRRNRPPPPSIPQSL